MAGKITIKDIAREAGVHFSTVSLALRDDPRLAVKTRERIQALAQEMGYVPDAAMKALCAYRESNRPHPIRSGLAYLTDNDLSMDFHAMLYREAREQASRLGYNLQYFNIREPGMSLKRLRSMWWSSGLRGVLIGAFEEAGSTLDEDWDSWICAAIGYSVEKPNFNRAIQDHFTNTLQHLSILRARGYRRIGMHVMASMNKRTHGLLHGAYLLDQAQNQATRIPLMSDSLDTAEKMLNWIRKQKLDLVIAGTDEYHVLRKTGLRIPDDIGFSLISWKSYEHDNPEHCAGFDMKAEVLAASSTSFLVSQIHENNYGLSRVPKSIMVTGEFHDGTTIRPGH